MRTKYIGNKPDRIAMVIRNQEASAAIPLGAPVLLQLTSTLDADGDGMDVVLPSTAAAINYQLIYGVNASYQLAAGQFGEAIVYGYTPSTLVKLNSRATSTDSWSSMAAIASGLLLTPDYTNNVWQTTAIVAANSTPQCILVDAIASIATAVSNGYAAADTRTVATGLKRSFVRML